MFYSVGANQRQLQYTYNVLHPQCQPRPNIVYILFCLRGGGGALFLPSSVSGNVTVDVMVLRVGDAWLIGVGKRAPHGFRCLWLVSPHGSRDKLKAFMHYFPT